MGLAALFVVTATVHALVIMIGAILWIGIGVLTLLIWLVRKVCFEIKMRKESFKR
jgi:hypothetical protein